MCWQRRSCIEKENAANALIYIGSVFYLNIPRKNEQKMYIYHCCMLYLTDPGAPGTFQTWRPPKSLISPSSGELSPLQYCTRSEVIRCRCSFHKLIIALYDCFKYNTRRQSHFFNLCPGWVKKNVRQDVWKRVGLAKRNATKTLGPLFFFPQTVNWTSQGDSGDRWQPEAGL